MGSETGVAGGAARQQRVLITIPCFNEERLLADSVQRLCVWAEQQLEPQVSWRVEIADNRSTDRTAYIAKELGLRHSQVGYRYLPEKGRGNSLRASWQMNDAEYYLYMDADLATDLSHVKDMLAELQSGGNVAIGCRLMSGARVMGRDLLRELASRGYNILLKWILQVRFKDAQCGFKGIDRYTRDLVLPYVNDGHWFFDTELLVLAERRRLVLREIPVSWTDHQGRESKVKVVRDVMYFFRRLLALRWRLLRDSALREFLGLAKTP